MRQSGVMVDMSSPMQLVDELIDRGLAESPATDWSVILPREWLDVLPVEADRLQRPFEDGRAGAVSCPVYRGFELVGMPLTRPVMILNDAGGDNSAGCMNKGTGPGGPAMGGSGGGGGPARLENPPPPPSPQTGGGGGPLG